MSGSNVATNPPPDAYALSSRDAVTGTHPLNPRLCFTDTLLLQQQEIAAPAFDVLADEKESV